MRTKRWAFTMLLLLATTVAATDIPTVSFDRSEISVDLAEKQIEVVNCQPVAIGSEVLLSARPVLIELLDGETAESIDYQVSAPNFIGVLDAENCFEDVPTSADPDHRLASVIAAAQDVSLRQGDSHIEVVGKVHLEDRRFAHLLIFPVTVAENGELSFATDIDIFVGNRKLTSDELLDPTTVTGRDQRDRTSRVGLSETTDYVIITNAELAPAFEDLAQYKNETGYRSEIKLIENILAQYSGRDDAEKLREYLKYFYASGGQYVLLGGNETIVPIRYAHHYRTSTEVTPEQLQVCDLYLADMNGEWEVDGDGVWGERYDDNADLTPELRVGRLPFDNTLEVSRYVEKLIIYETDPGLGDRSYLRRTFFFSSDQMRDYSGGGQHARVASAYPDWFVVDTANGVELSSGESLSPYNQLPGDLTETITEGFGIVNVIAHGRGDGFIVRSGGYASWPKSYYLSAEQHDSHGCFDSLSNNNKPGLYYSLACDNGGFDLELLHHTGPGMARAILSMENGGAVAFVAQSRWGWVGSSHLLQKAFFDTLFANPGQPAIEAFEAVRQQFSYYRDLALGQNFLGDPTLKVYTDIPEELNLAVTVDGLSATISVSDQSEAVDDCRILVSLGGEVVADFTTDPSGTVSLPEGLNPGGDYTVSAVKDGYNIDQRNFTPSISADVDDDPEALPGSFALNQNYPNPFNPSTVISFELPQSDKAELTVYNLLGQAVTTLFQGELTAGNHEITWNACSAGGQPVASGVYFYRLITEDYTDVKKMVLQR